MVMAMTAVMAVMARATMAVVVVRREGAGVPPWVYSTSQLGGAYPFVALAQALCG